MTRLFVNIDHVATVRQARRIDQPDPVAMALLAEANGADGITAHLREDRRHVQDDDIRRLHATCRTPFNLELSVAEEIVRLAEELVPHQVTIVPERREEITTEGGLDVVGHFDRIAEVTRRLTAKNIVVSLFIDPDETSIRKSHATGAGHVELHTGRYAEAKTTFSREHELNGLRDGARLARELGLKVNAGHGLNYENTPPVAAIPGLLDLNIGHAIVAHAIEVGFPAAVREMKSIVETATAG